MDPVIPADILLAVFVILVVAAAWAGLAGLGARIAAKRARLVEPETHGDMGGMPMPAPADYSDEVTDEHFKRIRELVDQDQFKDDRRITQGWATVPWKAGD